MLRDFCFWAVWAASPVHKKKLGADYEQLLRAFFSCFRGQTIFNLIFFENTKASALKSCIINLKKKKFEFFLNFFWNKTGFFRAAQILKFECTCLGGGYKGLTGEPGVPHCRCI